MVHYDQFASFRYILVYNLIFFNTQFHAKLLSSNQAREIVIEIRE